MRSFYLQVISLTKIILLNNQKEKQIHEGRVTNIFAFVKIVITTNQTRLCNCRCVYFISLSWRYQIKKIELKLKIYVELIFNKLQCLKLAVAWSSETTKMFTRQPIFGKIERLVARGKNNRQPSQK